VVWDVHAARSIRARDGAIDEYIVGIFEAQRIFRSRDYRHEKDNNIDIK
jgi:hypothetical protein